MRVIVIGGAGFIGSNLCKRLLEMGHQVACFDNFSLGNEDNIRELEKNSKFELVKGDASKLDELDEVFTTFKPEYVFHLAANSDIQASASNPDVEYVNTYSTTFQILSCMRKHNIKKLFFSSTSAVYGDKRDVELDENTPGLAPISYYGAAKLGSEALISAFSYMNDMSVLVFRFPNVIGENLTHGVIYDFMHRLKEDSSQLRILGDGRQTKPYIYVQDLVDAMLQFMEAPQGVTLYNVGVEGATSVTKIADIICEEMGLKNVKYNYTGGEGGWKGDVPRFQYNIDKIHVAGWKAKYNSDEAVRITVRKNLEA
ncbi:UDP-glucose 4-epimerase [Pseudobutyrivibrio sp. YE44]|uniref:NAD-dependent epimerase/dehydratase family protein n=1 Tax=Pseudobutyrivibrio sp. YE44 TaxID=1520802 RepID=UPI00087E6380|nr:NAD-dependent epimerase/dehydratase family protein [Pseudobutyrivibrio sp. YE44]SDB29029.1 UDP-glucose 4-epimerase [Pseudobutyrivibrio sp. YE44]